MKNESVKLAKKVAQGTVLAILIVLLSGLFNEDGVNRLMAAFGYGGGGGAAGATYTPIYKETPLGRKGVDFNSINFSMTLDAGKAGFLERDFGSGRRIEVYIPSKSTDLKTTIDSVLHSDYSFEITSTGPESSKELKKEMVIVFRTIMPENSGNLRVYYLNDKTGQWELLSNAKYSISGDKATIYTTKFGRYSLSYTGNFQKISFSVNSFVRDNKGRIYFISSNGKRHIRTLEELRSYRPASYTQVDESELMNYPDADVASKRYFSAGTFVKDNWGRIYLITNEGKKHIKTLSEFRNLRVKNLINVDVMDIIGYRNL